MEIAKKGEPHGGLGHTKVKADFDGHCVYNFFSYWKIGLGYIPFGIFDSFQTAFRSENTF